MNRPPAPRAKTFWLHASTQGAPSITLLFEVECDDETSAIFIRVPTMKGRSPIESAADTISRRYNLDGLQPRPGTAVVGIGLALGKRILPLVDHPASDPLRRCAALLGERLAA